MTATIPWPHVRPRHLAHQQHVWVRILVTSDLHGQLLPSVPDSPGTPQETGLARIATLVRSARQEATNSLLLDNGDFLQGSALSDLAATQGSGWTGPNPVITAMNALGYNGASLGNHEFNFGLSQLAYILSEARFPIVCANAVTRMADTGPTEDETFVPPYVILPIQAQDSAGDHHEIRIGLIGLLPPQITVWDHDHLCGRLETRGILEAAHAHVPRLRAQGAQIVLALAHTGIGTSTDTLNSQDINAENAALAVAALPGVDAVIAGHNHALFPRLDAADTQSGVCHKAATLAGKPAVMAGSRGSHLGVLDLCLSIPNASGCSVLAHHSQTRATLPQDGAAQPPDPEMMRLMAPVHANIARLTGKPLAQVPFALHSYTASLKCGRLQRLVLTAKRRALARALVGTPHDGLPVLAATAPFRTGGLGGPRYFTDLPPGVLTARDVARFYPFPNTLIGMRVNGHDLWLWLERAVSGFCIVIPRLMDQPLWDAGFPVHTFDTLAGLTYRIDLSQPPRFGADGRLHEPDASRITDLCFDGEAVQPDMEFALATNSFRAFGGGNYPHTSEDRILFRGQRPVRDLIAQHLMHHSLKDAELTPPPWTLCTMPDTSVVLRTGPGLRAYPEDISALGATDLGCDDEGFLILRVPLGTV